MIDHELGFEITDDSVSELDNWEWKEKFYRHHIFYDLLRRTPHALKIDYFHEFEECLRRLDLKVLRLFFEQLADHGYRSHQEAVIITYLTEMKKKCTNFVGLLRGLIS